MTMARSRDARQTLGQLRLTVFEEGLKRGGKRMPGRHCKSTWRGILAGGASLNTPHLSAGTPSSTFLAIEDRDLVSDALALTRALAPSPERQTLYCPRCLALKIELDFRRAKTAIPIGLRGA